MEEEICYACEVEAWITRLTNLDQIYYELVQPKPVLNVVHCSMVATGVEVALGYWMPCKVVAIAIRIFKEEAMVAKVEAVVALELVQVVLVNVVMVLVTISYAEADRSTYRTVTVQDQDLTFVVEQGS